MAFSSLLMKKKTTPVDLNPVASEDTYITIQSPNTNFGTATLLYLRNSTTNDMAALLKWDLTSLPTNPTKVELAVYTYSSVATNLLLELYRCISTWAENTVTFNNYGFSESKISDISLTPNTWNFINITTLYNAWKAGTYTNNGIIIFSTFEAPTRTTGIYSRESSNKPYLKITL